MYKAIFVVALAVTAKYEAWRFKSTKDSGFLQANPADCS